MTSPNRRRDRRKNRPKPYPETTLLRLPEGALDLVDAAADEAGLTRSDYLRRLTLAEARRAARRRERARKRGRGAPAGDSTGAGAGPEAAPPPVADGPGARPQRGRKKAGLTAAIEAGRAAVRRAVAGKAEAPEAVGDDPPGRRAGGRYARLDSLAASAGAESAPAPGTKAGPEDGGEDPADPTIFFRADPPEAETDHRARRRAAEAVAEADARRSAGAARPFRLDDPRR